MPILPESSSLSWNLPITRNQKKLLDGLRGFRCHLGSIILLSFSVFSLGWSGLITKALTTVIPADPLTGL